jgi:hypothetical protein
VTYINKIIVLLDIFLRPVFILLLGKSDVEEPCTAGELGVDDKILLKWEE